MLSFTKSTKEVTPTLPPTTNAAPPDRATSDPSTTDRDTSDRDTSEVVITAGSDDVYCGTCAAWHLLADTTTESVHRSAEGLIGYVRCQAGHLNVHRFAVAYPKPKPPASVLALRARLAAAEAATETR